VIGVAAPSGRCRHRGWRLDACASCFEKESRSIERLQSVLPTEGRYWGRLGGLSCLWLMVMRFLGLMHVKGEAFRGWVRGVAKNNQRNGGGREAPTSMYVEHERQTPIQIEQ